MGIVVDIRIGRPPLPAFDKAFRGFEALGATIDIRNAVIHAEAPKGLAGASVYLDVVSVGATMNVMLAAALAPGQTTIENAAKEPHIVDLANFLNAMGADIMGAGTDVIKIRGVERLRGGTYAIIPDQIEAGTYMAAVAATGGSVLIKNVIPKHLDCITAKLIELGCDIEELDEAVRVTRNKPINKINLKTLPYPGFPTDMQPQLTTVLCLAEGTSVVTEGVWDNRYRYVDELRRMGARIQVDGKVAIVEGIARLSGAPVAACDLRAGAAMVIAGLAAQGETQVEGIYHIERGYENLAEKLRRVGADITRVAEDDHPTGQMPKAN
jgi:UDP-N-acetylglucosamine 1-carboxyvinyltransferase